MVQQRAITNESKSGEYKDCEDADLVVICRRSSKPGETRLDLVAKT